MVIKEGIHTTQEEGHGAPSPPTVSSPATTPRAPSPTTLGHATTPKKDTEDALHLEVLPNSINPDEEKVLGVFWMTNFMSRQVITNKEKCLIDDHKSIDRSNNLFHAVKPVLTLRICLSFHTKTYDPLALVLPTRMIGNILFRSTLHILKGRGNLTIHFFL